MVGRSSSACPPMSDAPHCVRLDCPLPHCSEGMGCQPAWAPGALHCTPQSPGSWVGHGRWAFWGLACTPASCSGRGQEMWGGALNLELHPVFSAVQGGSLAWPLCRFCSGPCWPQDCDLSFPMVQSVWLSRRRVKWMGPGGCRPRAPPGQGTSLASSVMQCSSWEPALGGGFFRTGWQTAGQWPWTEGALWDRCNPGKLSVSWAPTTWLAR